MPRRLLSLIALSLVLACQGSKPRPVAPVDSRPPLPADCAMPDTSMRYPDVEPIFNAHCARCHTAALSNNQVAMDVFESTTYPFPSNQPERLLSGMAGQWRTRRGIDDAERCLVLQWIYTGALDADGNAPPYTPFR